MILFGLLMERQDRGGDVDWLPFWLGCVVGAVPWIAIACYLFGGGEAPTFVYAIFVSLFLLFNVFAVNMALGPWRDGVFSETAYILTSLVAKSALAWQVFGSTLAT